MIYSEASLGIFGIAPRLLSLELNVLDIQTVAGHVLSRLAWTYTSCSHGWRPLTCLEWRPSLPMYLMDGDSIQVRLTLRGVAIESRKMMEVGSMSFLISGSLMQNPDSPYTCARS